MNTALIASPVGVMTVLVAVVSFWFWLHKVTGWKLFEGGTNHGLTFVQGGSVPFVFEVRDLWPELPRSMGVIRNPVVLGAMSLLEWASYHSATRSIGLSPGIVDGIARRGIDAGRIALVPNGCDFEIFAAPRSRSRITSDRSRARYTDPIPPAPISRSSW